MMSNQIDVNISSTRCKFDCNHRNTIDNYRTHKASIPHNIFERSQNDLNKFMNFSNVSDCELLSDERENDQEVLLKRTTGNIKIFYKVILFIMLQYVASFPLFSPDNDVGSTNNCNIQVSSVPSPKVGQGLMQEEHTNKRGTFD